MTMAPPRGADDEAVHPFRLQVPQMQLDDLAKRLTNTRTNVMLYWHTAQQVHLRACTTSAPTEPSRPARHDHRHG